MGRLNKEWPYLQQVRPVWLKQSFFHMSSFGSLCEISCTILSISTRGKIEYLMEKMDNFIVTEFSFSFTTVCHITT